MKHTFHRFWVALCTAMTVALAFSPMTALLVRADDTTDESVDSIRFVGQMIELSTTEAPTTIVVRDFNEDAEGWTDYTVEINEDTGFGTNGRDETVMSDWITGDWVLVGGNINLNTQVVTAAYVVNQSINPFKHHGLNGWVAAIDTTASTMTVQWQGREHVVHVTSNTKMVVPPINPAALSDFLVGDRVRLRLINDTDNEARIIVALRRADHIFLKGRTRQFRAELVSLSGTDLPAQLEVTLKSNPHLRRGDVNNLIGDEGVHKVVIVDEHTKLKRRFTGEVGLSAFLPGDALFIVGRANDDGTITAKLIRDDQVVASKTDGAHGRITAINAGLEQFTLGGRDGEDRVFQVTDSTYIERNGVQVAFADLVVGDKVRARYSDTDDVHTVVQIFARSTDWIERDRLVEDDEVEREEEEEEAEAEEEETELEEETEVE